MLSNLKALTICAALIGAPALAQADPHAGHHPAQVVAVPATADAPKPPADCQGMSSQGAMMSGQGMAGGAMPMMSGQGGSMMQGGNMMQGGGAMMGGMEPGGMMANAQAMSSDIKALRQEIAALRIELRQRRGR
jgi:hypothetical protein